MGASQGRPDGFDETKAVPYKDRRATYALFDVKLNGRVPFVDTEKQTFKTDLTVEMQVYIPEFDESFLFRGRVVRSDGEREPETKKMFTVDEPLELKNFPLDVQRLHVTYEFELVEHDEDGKNSLGQDSDGKDLTRSDVMERLYNIIYFDMTTASQLAVAEHDNEWALRGTDKLEIYARPMSGDKVLVKVVLVVERHPTFYVINIALPVWCIVLFSFISFQFGAAELNERLQVTLTMVLTLVAFKLSVSTAKYIPIISCMTLMDNFMIAAFVVVALVALQNFVAFRLLTIAPWFNMWSAWALIGLWIATNFFMFFTAVRAVKSGDDKERGEDDGSFDTEAYARVENLLTEALKCDLTIEKLWELHGPTAGLAIETAALELGDRGPEDKAVALQLSKSALALTEKFRGAGHPDTLSSVVTLALLLHDQGKFDEAEPLLRRALAGRDEALGPTHRDTLTSVTSLALLLHDQDKLDEAEPLYRRALAGCEKALGPTHPYTLTGIHNLAYLLAAQDKLDEAETMYRRALAGNQKALGADHPDTLTSVNNLAGLLHDQGKPDEAEALYRRALAGRQKALGAGHPDTLSSVVTLAGLLHDQDKLDEAEPLFRRALAGRQKALGADHPDTLSSVVTLAGLLHDQDKLDEAEPLFRRALAGRQKALGADHPDTLSSVHCLASLLYDQDKLDEAEPLARRVLADREKVLGPTHTDTLFSVNNLALLLNDQGKLDEAETMFRRALAGREKALGPTHPDTLSSVHCLAALLAAQGKTDEAEALFRRAGM
ncbi:hypothetical protein FOA52_005810 [Chlamydomonas sp. UWO 241]|nr:hypothetical protein FOA52_005810 [Chlamydomonas sp. UWO 241]